MVYTSHVRVVMLTLLLRWRWPRAALAGPCRGGRDRAGWGDDTTFEFGTLRKGKRVASAYTAS